MKSTFLSAMVMGASLALTASAADPSDKTAEDEAKKKEEIRALIVADAQNKPAPAIAAGPKVTEAPAAAPAATVAAEATPAPNAPKEPATMLPQVEVNKSRITNLDIEINEKQRAIDFEKQKTKQTKLDATLNDSKLSKSLAIFGGSSSEGRSNLAKERVALLEEEKEILEAMKTAQTKEEKAELQQELDLLRQTRRELDQGPK